MNKVSKHYDYAETVAEEIQIATGISTKVVVNPTDKYNAFIIADTIAGEITFYPLFGELMQDFYRFIYVYAGKLKKYGIEERIKAQNSTFKTKEK
jgi:hypothetical protein